MRMTKNFIARIITGGGELTNRKRPFREEKSHHKKRTLFSKHRRAGEDLAALKSLRNDNGNVSAGDKASPSRHQEDSGAIGFFNSIEPRVQVCLALRTGIRGGAY